MHMSPGTLQGATVSTALTAYISLASTLQACHYARIVTPARHYFQHM